MLVQCCVCPVQLSKLWVVTRNKPCQPCLCVCVCACICYQELFLHEPMCRFYVLFIFDVMLFVCEESLSITTVQYALWTFLKCQLINLSTLLSLSPLPLLHGDAVRHHSLFVSFCTFIVLKFCSCSTEDSALTAGYIVIYLPMVYFKLRFSYCTAVYALWFHCALVRNISQLLLKNNGVFSVTVYDGDGRRKERLSGNKKQY